MRLCPFVLVVALGAGVPACRGGDEDDIRASVTMLCGHEGVMATAAAERLARYGRRAIPTVESAMHTASPTGKKNLIMALRRMGDVEAVPLLAHVAEFDPSADVRREAEWTLRQWAADGKAAERAGRAREVVRRLEEKRGVEEEG
jgi:hypothetical protein